MSIPATPPISFAEIKAEFGGLQLTPLNAYVRGGAYVPIQTLGNIPTAPPIAIRDFAGAVVPASLTYHSANATSGSGYAIAPPVVAPDLSSIVVAVSRLRTVNGGTSMIDIGGVNLLFDIAGATSPSVKARLPASQPRDVNGYWQLVSNYGLAKAVSPAQLNPQVLYTTYAEQWAAEDDAGAYQGRLRLNSVLPVGNAATPPEATLGLVGGRANLFVTVNWSMSVGTAIPPYSAMSWNTHNVTNTFVEFPIILDVYDGALLRASYNTVLRFEMDSTLNFNPS